MISCNAKTIIDDQFPVYDFYVNATIVAIILQDHSMQNNWLTFWRQSSAELKTSPRIAYRQMGWMETKEVNRNKTPKVIG
jgi:beta-xylosidase